MVAIAPIAIGYNRGMSISSGILALVGFAATIAVVVGLSVLAERWLDGWLDRDERAQPSAPSAGHRERPLLRIVKRGTARRKAA